MKTNRSIFFLGRSLWTVLATGLACSPAHAALQVIGTQYRMDQLFPEFNCYWNFYADPSGCPSNQPGATVHVDVKNTGASSVTIDDATIAGYSLKTVIKMTTANYNPKQQASIYFYWDSPPQEILDAGEPVWWRADPPTIPAGGVGQVTVRLRSVPTNHVSFGVVSSSGTVRTNIAVDAGAPRIASIGYSEDLKKIYVHWWRASGGGGNGAAPSSVWLNGTNVTALTTTVGDPSLNFAASVITLPTALRFFSFNVYQGVYADGQTATAGQRAWTNKFIYCTWSTFEGSANYTGEDWVDEASAHGFNASEVNQGNLPNDSYMKSKGYGYIILDKTKLRSFDPDLWFLNDEPDAQENNQGNTHCGTGTRLPCDSSKYAGTLVMKEAVNFAAELRALRPNVPTTVNLDGGLQPQSYYTWGPAVDVLESNNYYEVRLKDAYLFAPERIPLYGKPKNGYAVARTGTAGAEPNPFRHILYSCKGDDNSWPYPFPTSKHIEAYYSLAGGTKGFGYWWFNPPRGLYNASQAPALWKEMGLIGNEVKTARNLIVKSTPVDVPLSANSPWIWTRGVASGVDTLLLYVINENFFNDITGCKVTNVPNATVTVTLPAWMQNSPSAFEITRGGQPGDANWTLNGGQMQFNLGTLQTVRMIIVTTDATLRSAVQQRFDTQVKANVCSFAPELCVNTPPGIALHPSNKTVPPGGTANFNVVAGGTSPLSYRWQKNNANLSDGGRISGSATPTLTISSVVTADNGNYRCVVTNAYGSTNSLNASLVVTNIALPPMITEQPVAQTVVPGATANFTVQAEGSEPISYRWQKNNANLTDGGKYSGSTTPALTVTDADASVAGNYRCVLTNAYGSTNSASAALTIDLNYCQAGQLLGHGDMEEANNYLVCPEWASYSAGNGTATFFKYTGIVHGGLASQQCRNMNGGTGSLLGILQTVDANVGDAFTFEGWVYPASNPGAGQQVAMVAAWDGSTASPTVNANTTWNISTGAREVWTRLQNLAGNATSTNVTLFLDSRRTASSQDLTAYWDDVVAYRAFVPPAPLVSLAGSTSLDVDLLSGCNATNAAAQFAISIGGGAYTLGTHWVQANGTVSATPVWQTDAMWGVKTVTGLSTGVPYSFKVRARYSSTITQPTTLGDSASGTPAGSLPPTITQQPSNQTVGTGGTASFTVVASGATPFSYQWQKNQGNLSNGGHYAGVTTDTLTISNCDSNDAATYRCIVTNVAGGITSSNATLTVTAPSPISDACFGIVNADFEGGFSSQGGGLIGNQWTEWEAAPGVVVGYAETTIKRGGSSSQRIRVWGAGGSSGGVYQRLSVIPGLTYTVSVWMYAGDASAQCSLGVDPAGGTNPNLGVTWSSVSTNVAWAQKTWTGTATGDYLTIYYKVASGDSTQRNGYFDDATPAGTLTGPRQLSAQSDNNTITLAWPSCLNARLERAGGLTPPVSWSTVTNAPVVGGGQKSVTLSLSGGGGYFRLVLE